MAQVACEEAPFTDLKLARLFGVVKSTINEWKKTYPEFKQALKDGKDVFDTTKVEKSFLKRCTGYKFTETTREPAVIARHEGDQPTEIIKPEMVVTRAVTRHVVPDAKGCMDWLCNRMPSRWKKLKHVEITGKDGGPVKTTGMVAVPSGPMTIAEWEAEVREARKTDLEVEPGLIPGGNA